MIKFELNKMQKNGSLIFLMISMGIIFFFNRQLNLTPYELTRLLDYTDKVMMKINENESNRKVGFSYDEKLADKELLREYKVLYEKSHELYKTARNFKKVKGYPYGLKRYQEDYYEFTKEMMNFAKKYELEISDMEKRNMEFKFIEFDEAKKNNSYVLSSTIMYSNNSMRNIIFNSGIFFGVPYFIVFFFCFSGIFSREREEGTLDFLYTEPIKRRKIVLSKYIALCIIPILYILFFIVVSTIVYSIEGVPIDGFNEIHRVFSEEVEFISAKVLLLKILLAFLLLSWFYSSIMLFLSSRSSRTEIVMSILIIAFSFFKVVGTDVSGRISDNNPLCAFDYLRCIIGRYYFVFHGEFDVFEQMSFGMGYYFIFGILSVIFLFLSMLPYKNRSFSFKNKKSSIISNLMDFEREKILSARGFFIYLIGLLAIIILIFIKAVKYDENAKLSQYDTLNSFEEMYERDKSNLSDIKKNKLINAELYEDESDEDKNAIYELIVKDYEEMVKYSKFLVDNHRNAIEEFEEEDGEKYYKSLEEIAKWNLDNPRYGYSESFYATTITLKESLAVLRDAAKKKVKPMLEGYILNSAKEGFKNLSVYDRTSEYFSVKSHNSFYLPYRMIRFNHLDWILLIWILFAVCVGYIPDKKGSQMDLMYTTPVSREEFHTKKLFASLEISAVIIAISFILIFLFGLFSEGLGSWDYSIVEYKGKDMELMPILEFTIKSILLLIIQAGFIFALSLFTSLFVNDRGKHLLITLGIIFLGILAQKFLPLSLISPFRYIYTTHVVSGAQSVIYNSVNETYLTACIVTIIWGIAIYYLGILKLKKI